MDIPAIHFMDAKHETRLEMKKRIAEEIIARKFEYILKSLEASSSSTNSPPCCKQRCVWEVL
jgi:hypothetical protein